VDMSTGRKIVTPSASCSAMIRNNYGKLFHNSSLHNDCKELQRNMYEFTDFVVNILKVDDVGARLKGKAVLHDSCSALREYKLGQEARQLLKGVEGLELVEMKDTETCCGFGGAFAIKFEAISSSMGGHKLKNALVTEADFIVSTDTSCLMHLDGLAKKNGESIKTMHIADVLAQGW